MKTEEFVLDRLSDSSNLYLKSNQCDMDEVDKLSQEVTMDFLALYRIDEITFEDKAPRKEALENVISSMSIEGVNFVYIIKGDASGVSFYYGVSQDFSYKGERSLGISEIGEKILKPSLQGNFRGSVITEIDANERKKILSSIDSFKETEILEGVPGINKDDEKFQSVDRVIDVMLGDEFALILIAKPITGADISSIQNSMYHLYNSIAPLGKSSVQESTAKSTGTSESITKGESKTEGTSSSKSEQKGTGSSTSHTDGGATGTNKGTNYSSGSEKSSKGGSEGTHEDKNWSNTTSESNNESSSTGTSDSTSTSQSTSSTESTQIGKNVGSSTTLEVVNKKVQDWIKYMDDVVLPRLDYGLGKGLFITTTVLLGQDPASMIKLENTLKSVYGGEAGNRMPLKAFLTNADETCLLKRLQVPIIKFDDESNEDEIGIRTACSQFFMDSYKAFLVN